MLIIPLKLSTLIVLICIFPPLSIGEFQTAPAPDPSTIVGYRFQGNVLIFDRHFSPDELQTLSGHLFSGPPLTSCSCDACATSCQEDEGNQNNEREGDQNNERINAKLVTINRLSHDANFDLKNVLAEIASADVNDPYLITTEDEQVFVNYNECWCVCLSNGDG